MRHTVTRARRRHVAAALSLLTALGIVIGGATADAATDVSMTFHGTVTQGDVGVAGATVVVLRSPALLGQTPVTLASTTASSTGAYTLTARAAPGTKIYVRATRDDGHRPSAVYATSAYVGAGSTPTTASASAAAYPLVTPFTTTAADVSADIGLARLGSLAVTIRGGLTNVALERLDGSEVFPVIAAGSKKAYSFTGLYPGTYRVRGSNWDSTLLARPKVVTVTAGRTATVALRPGAPLASVITGTVTRGGKAQSKAPVLVYGARGCLVTAGRTDKNGAYRVVAPGGSTKVTVSFANYPARRAPIIPVSPYVGPDKVATVTPGKTTTVNATVALGGKITGTVTLGRSAGSSRTKAANVKVVTPQGMTVAVRKITAKKPGFAVPGLREGRYRVVAQQRTGRKLYASRTVTVQPARTTKVGVLTPRTKGATLRGSFRTKAPGIVTAYAYRCGTPFDNIDGSEVGGNGKVTRSGTFAIKNLVPGTYYLQVDQKTSTAAYVRSGIRATVRRHGSTIRVTKASTAYDVRFTGKVTFEGRPVAGADLQATDDIDWDAMVGSVQRTGILPLPLSGHVRAASTTGALTGYLDPRYPVTRMAVSFGRFYEDTTVFPSNSPYYFPVVTPTKVTGPADLAHVVLGPVEGA